MAGNKDSIFHFRFTNKAKIVYKDEVLQTLNLWKENKELSEKLLLLVDNYIENSTKQQEHQEISKKLQEILEIFNSLNKAEKQVIFDILYPKVTQDKEYGEKHIPENINPINPEQTIFQTEKPEELSVEDEEDDPYKD